MIKILKDMILSTKANYNVPITRPIFLSLMTSICCLLISFVCGFQYKDHIYSKYREMQFDIARYVLEHTDVEDIKKCIRTQQSSEKYNELYDFIENLSRYHGIHYIYIIEPFKDENGYGLRNVMASTTEFEKELGIGYEPIGYIQRPQRESYPESVIKLYYEAQHRKGPSFFHTPTVWGDDYTCALPICDKNGKAFCILCVDFECKTIMSTVRMIYTANIILFMLIIAQIFMLLAAYTQSKIIEVNVKTKKYNNILKTRSEKYERTRYGCGKKVCSEPDKGVVPE